MTVAEWPSYILRAIPAETREQMSARAAADDVSLADVVRQALCHHYNMDCDPASFAYQPELDSGNDILLIRLQPDVWRKMKRETRARYGAFRQLILQAITDYLEVTQ